MAKPSTLEITKRTHLGFQCTKSTPPSSAAAKSRMDDTTSENRYRSPRSPSLTTATLQNNSEGDEFDGVNDGDPAVWSAFTQNFRQVQSVLDRNRVLIQQVNENHQSKTHDNMVKNVALIQEINGNISKVTSLYSDLSANFSSVCQQRRSEPKSDSQRKR